MIVNYYIAGDGGEDSIASCWDGTPPNIGETVWLEDQRAIPGSGLMRFICVGRSHSVKIWNEKTEQIAEVVITPARKSDRRCLREWQAKLKDQQLSKGKTVR